jgi:sec-independent protein translocase protein TatA
MNGGEMFFVMFLCLLMFGSKKLPELAKALGQSMREFKKAANEVEDNFHSAVREEERKKAQLQAPPPPSPPPAAAPSGPLDSTSARPANPPEKL